MPTVIVEADEGRTVEQKRGLVKEITEAVCKNFKVEPQAVTVYIHEGRKENRGKAGKLAIRLIQRNIFMSRCQCWENSLLARAFFNDPAGQGECAA